MKSWELKDNGYEHLGTADDGGGYDWETFDVWLKDGVFYWASDHGCSCSGPYDYHSFPEGFDGHGNAHEAIKAVFTSGLSLNDSESLIFKLMDYKPKDEK